MEVLSYKRIVLNLKKVCEKNQNGESNLEFLLIFYQVPIVIFIRFIYYNIITLCYISYLDDHLVMYFKFNHFTTKKKNFVYFRYERCKE